MPTLCLEERAVGNPPQPDCTIVGGRDQALTIRREGDTYYLLNANPDCVTQRAATLGISFDYLYLLKTPVTAGAMNIRNPALLMYLLSESPMYVTVYENSEVILFTVKNPP